MSMPQRALIVKPAQIVLILLTTQTCSLFAGPYQPETPSQESVHERTMQCLISTHTSRSFQPGRAIPVTLTLSNVTDSGIQVPLPYGAAARIQVFLLDVNWTNVIRKIPLSHSLAAGEKQATWWNLQPRETKTIQCLADLTHGDRGEVLHLLPGEYQLQVEIEHHLSGMLPAHVKFKRFLIPPRYGTEETAKALPDEEQAKLLAKQEQELHQQPPGCVDMEILWRGHIKSNTERVVLVGN
jgi:hypothetical protein